MRKQPEVAPVVDPDVVAFEIRDGMRRIRCTVSTDALDAVASLAVPSTAMLRRGAFDRFRTLIDAAAKLKMGTMGVGFAGPLVLTAADLRLVPITTGQPQFGSVPRVQPRPAVAIGAVDDSGERAASSDTPHATLAPAPANTPAITPGHVA